MFDVPNPLQGGMKNVKPNFKLFKHDGTIDIIIIKICYS